MNILFSVNTYDSDGDLMDTGVFLHFKETRVKVSENPEDFVNFVGQILKIQKELSERYT